MYLTNVLAVLTHIMAFLGILQPPVDDFPHQSPYVFETNRLPSHDREMASVGNGHVATIVYSNTVYMNGLYNGFNGESHRARIPSRNNIRINIESDVEVFRPTFVLNALHGTFTEKFDTSTHSVQIYTYAHRYFHKVLVSQVHVRRLDSEPSSIALIISSHAGPPSDDLSFELDSEVDVSLSNAIDSRPLRASVSCGHTIIPENSIYQKSNSTVCIVALKPPNVVTVDADTREAWFTFYAAYDTTREGALEDFNAVTNVIATEGHQSLYHSHISAWKQIWSEGRIEIDGNLELAKTINGALYHIHSSLPITTKTHSRVGPYYGISPGGLSNGALLKDYQGHSFWDTEIWIFPVILNFFPAIAQELLNYRVRKFEAAKDYAKATGYEGARYPWESAFTGSDVTPLYPYTRDLQIHVTADISLAFQKYFASTFDIDWLTSAHVMNASCEENVASPCEVVRAIAQFWVSRGTFNTVTNKYDINQVMPPDEDNYPVNNSIYTNVAAAHAIHFAKHIEPFCDKKMNPIPKIWLEFAETLNFTFDPVLNYHPEFDGYKIGTRIKQADVVLLGYPLFYAMDRSTRQNDLRIYENATSSTGPAMTWAMHAINHLELNERDKAEIQFRRSYQPYLLEPFKTWSENPAPRYGASNFLTGMGGFLQAIVNGHGGLRIHSDRLVFLSPSLLPNSTSLDLIGLKYLGSSLNVRVGQNKIGILCTKSNDKILLNLEANGVSYPLNDGKEVILQRDSATNFTIRGNHFAPPYPK